MKGDLFDYGFYKELFDKGVLITNHSQHVHPSLLLEFIDPADNFLGWQVVDGHHLEKTYRFADFGEALAFTNRIGAVAERQGHHPDIHLTWGKVGVSIWTHKIDGLTESDFILAAKFDAA